MYQTLAVSPLLFEQLNSEDKKTVLECFTSLDSEIILCDKDKYIFDEYERIIDDKSNPLLKALIKDFINKSSTMGKIRSINEVIASVRVNKKLINLETELALIKTNLNWHIILADSTTKLKFCFTKKGSDFELASPKDYISPNENSNILSRTENISKKRGDSFDLIKWLNKYLSCAEFIELHDGYISSKRALINIDKIFALIKTINHELPIKVIAMSDKARNKYYAKDDGIKIRTRIIELLNQHGLVNSTIILHKDKSDISDRKLVSDKFVISLGHSLDAVREDNYVVKQFDMLSSKV